MARDKACLAAKVGRPGSAIVVVWADSMIVPSGNIKRKAPEAGQRALGFHIKGDGVKVLPLPKPSLRVRSDARTNPSA
jgi:hypothetical protein